MTRKVSITHLLCALMKKRNGRSNGNKWAVHLRAPISNVLAVEHKYRNSLSIKVRNNYKRKEQHNPKVHTNIHPNITPSQFRSKHFSLTFWLKHWSVLANTTSVYPISFSSFDAGSSISWDEKLNCWFFASSISTKNM